jgi:hypothetical protein
VTTVAARTGSSASRRVTWPLVVAGSVLGVSVLLHVRDPHRSGSWGYCPWFLLTGTYCPGCGGLRAVNDLTHGDLRAAASSNLLFVASVPVLVAWWARWTLDRWRGVVRHVDPGLQVRLALGFLALALCFAVARNTPVGAWLAP